MIKYEDLPAYKLALDLAIYFEKIVKSFDRYHRYALGADLRNQSKLIVRQILRVNVLTDKQSAFEELILQIEELKLLIRLAKEVKAFHNFNSYEYSSKLIANLSRQIDGWYEKKKNIMLV